MSHTESPPAASKHARDITPGPNSKRLAERREEAVAHAIASTLPYFVDTADGNVVRDVDGTELIDFSSGIAVTNVGNAAPEIVSRVQAQVEKFTHTCFLMAPYENYVEVCEKLNAATPGTFAKRSALFNSGAEAVENAVKFARSYTGRSGVVAFDHAFHGRTNLAMSMTAKYTPYKQGFGPFAGEVYRAPMSYPFRDGLDGAGAAQQAINVLDKQAGRGNVAAVVIEPIQGEGGFIVPAEGFLPAIQQWCREAGALFVVDEIQSGFGRTGQMFASEHEGLEPDLVVTAKGIAGGLPLSAVTGRAEIMDQPQPGGIGGTYAGNPLACAAALGTFEAIEKHNLVDRANWIGEIIRETLDKLASEVNIIGEVRGRGAMQAIEFVEPDSTRPGTTQLTEVVKRCHSRGLIALAAGTHGNVLRMLPPLVISEQHLRTGLTILAEAVREVAAN